MYLCFFIDLAPESMTEAMAKSTFLNCIYLLKHSISLKMCILRVKVIFLSICTCILYIVYCKVCDFSYETQRNNNIYEKIYNSLCLILKILFTKFTHHNNHNNVVGLVLV